ncbi:hypothetical protein COOONC_18821, partial [Cooperia oncophora]
WLYRPKTFLGIFDPRSADQINSTHDCCSILGGGALLLHNVNRSMIERYVCVARQGSNSVQRIVHFRLDYSSWYSLDLFNSVFWGGVATAVLACSFSFLLNITWILTRKSILWWIQRMLKPICSFVKCGGKSYGEVPCTANGRFASKVHPKNADGSRKLPCAGGTAATFVRFTSGEIP